MRTLKYGKIVAKTSRLTDFCPKSSLVYIVYCYISSVMQFDKFFHPVLVDVHRCKLSHLHIHEYF